MVLLFTEKKIYQKELMIIMKQIKKINLKSQVRAELEEYIHSLDLDVANKLPREEELCRILGISRVTLRSVLDDLAAEGIIIRVHGRGTFVNPHFREIACRFDQAIHFPDLIESSGYKARMEILEIRMEPAEKEVAEALRLAPGAQVWSALKVFYADEHPCVISYDYVSTEIFSEEALEKLKNYKDSIFYFLYQETGRRIAWDKVEIDTILSDDILPRGMKVKGFPERKPFLFLSSVNYDEKNRESVYIREYINTSILKYSQIRKRIFGTVNKKETDPLCGTEDLFLFW